MIFAKPPPAPLIPIEWCEVTIIFRRHAGNVDAIDGMAYGTLTIHPSLNDPASVDITHLPSKVRIARMGSVDDARTAAEWLWNQCRTAWTGDNVDKSKLTREALEWLQQ